MPGICDPILPAARVDAMRRAGEWHDRLLIDHVDETAAAAPDRDAVLAWDSVAGELATLNYQALVHRSRRIALGLLGLGVQPGDVVAFQLPNRWEFVALHLACLRIGAVSNPLMPIFRERELSFMLEFAQARVLVVPDSFRGFSHAGLARELQARLPHLEHVLVVDGTGGDAFERQILRRRWEDEFDAEAEFAARRAGPNDVIQLLYTSGTTGRPKGVMHTSNTLLAGCAAYAQAAGLGPGTRCYMASPLAHQTGFMYGLMTPLMLGTSVLLQDIWDPATAWRLIGEHRLQFTMGATPFLADLTHAPDALPAGESPLDIFVCGGAPIPRVLAEEANARLGVRVVAAWGMSECGVVTMTLPGDPEAKVFGTDGVALPGTEVRVVGADDAPLPAGEEGRLQTRGTFLFVGYLKKPDLYGVDGDGWFDTGDLARMDDDGYVRITGRAKDIIIRGGENIPVAELEDCLYRLPQVEDAAVVAMPDPRLGERACAFVTLRTGQALDLAALQAAFEAEGFARQYVPERLEVIEAMPRTASGKIQKFELRARLVPPAEENASGS